MKRTSLDLPRFGKGIGLARTARLAAGLGLDLASIGQKAVVITGSNGKGSTAAWLTALHRAAGGRVGSFFSPHLFAFNERFKVDDVVVDDADIIAAECQLADAIAADKVLHPEDQLGEFEAWFLVALLVFETAGCDHLVVEAGIGGRYDPTRLLKAPLASIVSLDLEHTSLLGASLREIALDKLDIAPPGARVLVGRGVDAEWDNLAVMSGLKSVTLEMPCAEFDQLIVHDSIEGHSITMRHAELGRLAGETRLHGARQVDNLQLAIGLARASRPEIDPARWPLIVEEAMGNAACPGRLEVLPGETPLLVDVGHTPAAVEAAVTGVRALTAGRRAILLLGMSHNKDVDGMLAQILPAFETVIVGAAFNGLAPDQLAARVKAVRPSVSIQAVTADAGEALATAEASSDCDILVGLGGLFWAGSLRASRLGLSLDELDFS